MNNTPYPAWFADWVFTSSEYAPLIYDPESKLKENNKHTLVRVHAKKNTKTTEFGQVVYYDIYISVAFDRNVDIIFEQIMKEKTAKYQNEEWGDVYTYAQDPNRDIGTSREDKIKDFLLGSLNNDNYLGGMGVGLIGGLTSNLYSLYEAGKSLITAPVGKMLATGNYIGSVLKTAVEAQSLLAAVKKVYNDGREK